MNFDVEIIFYILSIKENITKRYVIWNSKVKHPIENINTEKNFAALQTI